MDGINRFGTTSDMVISELNVGETVHLIAIDSRGIYLTDQSRLDNGLADVNRYAVSRDSFVPLLESAGLSAKQLFEENKDKIKVQVTTSGKKINPLKASKRGM